MELQIFIDGKWYPKSQAVVSVFDHGFLYGDGVFEGIRAYKGCVFKFQEHLDRLYESAHTIMLDIPMTKQEMSDAVVETLKKNNLTDGYIRLVVSRGTGDLGLDPAKCKKASVIIITDNIVLYPQELYEKGMAIITVPTSRNLPNALNPAVKSLNYLNNIMAKIEAKHCGYNEAIMLDPNGNVAECTGDNVFVVKNGELITPATYVGALKGVTRDAIIELARKKGITVRETVLTRHEIYNAEEMFLTGTAAELIPIVEVDARKIGNGEPGSVTLSLLKEFKEITSEEGLKYSV